MTTFRVIWRLRGRQKSTQTSHRGLAEDSQSTHTDFTEDSQRTRRGLAENSQRIHRGLTEPSGVVLSVGRKKGQTADMFQVVKAGGLRISTNGIWSNCSCCLGSSRTLLSGVHAIFSRDPILQFCSLKNHIH